MAQKKPAVSMDDRKRAAAAAKAAAERADAEAAERDAAAAAEAKRASQAAREEADQRRSEERKAGKVRRPRFVREAAEKTAEKTPPAKPVPTPRGATAGGKMMSRNVKAEGKPASRQGTNTGPKRAKPKP